MWGTVNPTCTVTLNSYRLDKKFLYLILHNKGKGKEKRASRVKMEDEDGGLFDIEVSSADESANEKEKVPRDFQSEEDFQRQRAAWRPKVETGEVGVPFL